MKKSVVIIVLLCLSFSLSAQYKVKGDVMYAGNTQAYLDSVTVVLKQGATVIATTTTNSMGYYVFNNIPNGTYTLSGSCSKAWGGCNSNDALSIIKHVINMSPLTSYKKVAADVNNTGNINALDAAIASRRFVKLITGFAAGDWAVESQSVTVNNSHITKNLRAICFGDANASFAPPAAFTCGNNLVDSRDAQSYPTVLIGDQCWMAKNLNIGTFIYGVGNQTNNYVIEKYCYHNNTANCAIYGGWYQWDELMNYDTANGGQGICPTGWHVPTDGEWDVLVNGLGGESTAGTALKSGGSSGFNALMAGWVKDCQKFFQLTLKTNYWSSTNFYGINAWSRVLTSTSSSVTRQNITPHVEAVSVRCLKD
jgi:uncharacterized protein (TIGR02145 family)